LLRYFPSVTACVPVVYDRPLLSSAGRLFPCAQPSR
jgi:hypothetical protein